MSAARRGYDKLDRLISAEYANGDTLS